MSKLSLDPARGSHTTESVVSTVYDIAFGVRSAARHLAGTWVSTSDTILKTGAGAASTAKSASKKSYRTLRTSLGSSASRKMLGTCATAALCLTAPLLGAAAGGAAITCALITICMALLFLVLYTVVNVVAQTLRCASLLLSMVCNFLYNTFSTTKSFLKGKPPVQATKEQLGGDLDKKEVDSDQKRDAEKTEEKSRGLGGLFKSLAINMISFVGTALVAVPILLFSVVLLTLLPVCLLCATVYHIYQGNYEDRSNDKGNSSGGRSATTYYPMKMSASGSNESLNSMISEGGISNSTLPSYSTATAANPGNTDDTVSHHTSSGKKPASHPESDLQEVVAETMSQRQQRNVS